MKRLIVGNGLDKKTSQGPLINEKAVLKVERHIKESVDQGARVICGGNRLNEMGGTFFEPTVLLDVTNEMPVSREETFGPIAPLLRYESYCMFIEILCDCMCKVYWYHSTCIRFL
jgi:succinate-semialdehyde dehydrogenase/glutarate-semialdehyde dehydrogenase